MEPFTFQEIQLNKGDLIYLFSDGYADQFGGPSNKKFKYKALKELLLNNSQMPMCKQKEIIETTFNNWKGKNKQIDDVTIMGIKI
ncbi:MAG: SpoIIE family protein phosphatase, partial [Bacteroidetes bacterium]|nr:SpoIIE family protein phosphatase [Bacteroidota bacterium]